MSGAIAIKESPSLFPSETEWKMLKEQASLVVKTGFLPKAVDTAEKAITIALKGRELGIAPMHAFSHIHIIQGKPTISAELMLSMIYKNCPGSVINYLESTSTACRIEAKRPGHKPSIFAYTIEEAKTAGLLSKDSWRNYPAAMLRARTVSIVGRALFPDAIMGCSYTPEELGAEIGDEGMVVDIPSDVAPKTEAKKLEALPKEKAAVRTRKVIGAEIMAAANELNLSKKDMEDWAIDQCGKCGPDMSIPEMEKFLETLQIEVSILKGAEK